MALVTTIEEVEREIRGVHNEAKCTCWYHDDADGNRYLQIVTTGSTGRKMTGNVSQTIQLTEQAARQLKLLIEKYYPQLQ